MKLSDEKKFKFSKIHIIIKSILISFLLTINSSYINNRRKKEKVKNFNNKDIKKPIILRKLDFVSDSLQVCSRSSKDLVKYFETGDTNYVKLYSYDEEVEPSDVVKNFINILSNEGDSNENNTKYIKHLSPMIIFLTLGILCIPGWFIFCACACCDCKCFNCCKTIKCRIPFFIIVSILNLLFIANSIVGIIKIEPIFEGLSNTECSILRFINEALDGETKDSLPKWGGVAGIINIFNNTIYQIEKISLDDTYTTTKNKKEEYSNAVNNFIDNLKDSCDIISDESNYKYQTGYIFDIANDYGKYISGNSFTSGSYADKWVKEAEITNDVNECYNKLGLIIRSHATETMSEAEEVIQGIGDGIEEIKENLGKNILEYSEKINDNGKLIFRLIFIVLLIISLLLETFFIFLLLTASRKCNCQCCVGLMKFLIHIFWNILTALVILLFLFGGLICTISRIGKDFFEAMSFLISSRNLLAPSPRIFGDSAPYLDVCINGDGVIADELGIESDLENIGALKTVIESLDKMINSIIFKESQTNIDTIYDEIINEINKRSDDSIDFGFVNPTTNNNLSLYKTMSQLNEKLHTCNINDTLSFSCNTEFPKLQQGECLSVVNTSKCISVKDCKNELNTRYLDISCSPARENLEKIDKIYSSLSFANDDTQTNSIKNQAYIVKESYRTFISNTKTILEDYINEFRPFSILYNNFIGNGSILGVINCAFIGKNIKVLLNYLDDTINKGFFTLGIVLIVDGFVMLCCIAFSILLLSIIDEVNKIRITEDEENAEKYLYEHKHKSKKKKENPVIYSSNNKVLEKE